MASTVERTVLFDRIAYMGTHLGKPQRKTANKGEVIELHPDEAKRLDELKATGSEEELIAATTTAATPTTPPTSAGALRLMTVDSMAAHLARDPDSADQIAEWMEALIAEHETNAENARRAATPGQEPGQATDEELAAMSIAELTAHLSQNPNDLDRVDTLEDNRKERRSGVDDLLQKHREARATL
jgi:hypothetical protein